MSLTNYESELLRSVAASPVDVPRYLVSPETNMGGQWFTSPLAIKVFSAVARDALNDKATSLVSILAQCSPSKEEMETIKNIWLSKSGGIEEARTIVSVLRNESMARGVNRIWSDYNSKLKSDPEKIRDHINDMGTRLSYISHDGVEYNPIPSSHRDDLDVTIGASWRCHTIDAMFDGGVPNQGYMLGVAPTGSGKSSMLRTLAVYSIIRSVLGDATNVSICTNEMRAGETSRTIHAALHSIWQGERDDDELWRDMDSHMRIYERVHDWTRLDRILYWDRPQVAIIDSLDNLDFPPGTEKYPIDEKHKARANGVADMSVRNGCFISVVGNASEGNQRELRDGVEKIKSVMAYGSAWYQNMSSWSFAIARSKFIPNQTEIKRVKNRANGRIGEVWNMGYAPEGKYYYDLQTVELGNV